MSNKVIYSKYNRERKTQFQIATIHYQNDYETKVKKIPLTTEAFNHIKAIHENSLLLKDVYQNIEVLTGEIIDGCLVYDFIQGTSWDQRLLTEVLSGNLVGFIKLLESFNDILTGLQPTGREDFISSDEFNTIFGQSLSLKDQQCVHPANIDFIFDNVFFTEGGTNVLLDCEWVFPFKIPIKYILFRSIYAFWVKYNVYIEPLISFDDILIKFEIDLELKDIFLTMEEEHFQLYVNGDWYKAGFFGRYVKEVHSLNTVTGLLEQSMINMKLFFPSDRGYSEDYVISKLCTRSTGIMEVSFILDANYSNKFPLRIDLLERPGVICFESIQIHEISETDSNYSLDYNMKDITYNDNIIQLEEKGEALFLSIGEDPQFFLNVNSISTKQLLVLRMRIDLNITPYVELILRRKTEDFQEEVGVHQQVLDKSKLENAHYLRKMDAYLERINVIESEKVAYETEISTYLERINVVESEKAIYNKGMNTYRSEIKEMKESLSWKVTAPIRYLGRIFKNRQ
ncbi:hypothetical protein ACP8HI_25565 [Paenibacillus sp. FA6]|uniref:hypothetical protein n=1 Tax=Paenibacillus sp. FA6 TaxID=3413029 RepID=UPI003F65F30B